MYLAVLHPLPLVQLNQWPYVLASQHPHYYR